MRALFAGILIALLATPVMAGERPAGKGGLQLQGQAQLTETKVNAEPAYAPNVSLTSSNCIGSIGASGGGNGVFSFGIGGTYGLTDCFKIEVAKVLLGMGKRTEAHKLLTSIDFVSEGLNPNPKPYAPQSGKAWWNEDTPN